MKTNGRNSARYGPWVILLAGGSEWETQDLRMNLEPKGMCEREREREREMQESEDVPDSWAKTGIT